MAKELPYFKFEPNAWENGNIQMLSREDKGLFIDLCALYWSRLGDVPEKLAIQKLCGGNATALNSLYEIEAATVLDGQICIDFLNEQLSEFEDTSKTNSENAKKGWEKRRIKKGSSDRNATALNSQSESDAIREEEIREEEIREEKKREDKREKVKREFYNSLTPYVSKYSKEMLRQFYEYWTEHGPNDIKVRFQKETSFSVERRLRTWSANEPKFGPKKEAETATVYKPSKKSKSALDQLKAEEEAYQKEIQNAE